MGLDRLRCYGSRGGCRTSNRGIYMEEIGNVVEVAKGVSEYGALAMMAGAYLVISMGIMWAVFKWFKTIIDKTMEATGKGMEAITAKTAAIEELLNDIADSMRPTTMLQIKSISNTCFDLSVELVLGLIIKVREENNIVDKDGTKAKIHSLLLNIHEDRNSRFDNIRYRGNTLTHYTSLKWVDWVAEVVEKEVYAAKVNNSRARTNVETVYNRIRLDFYHNLTR